MEIRELTATPLFRGVTPEEAQQALAALDARRRPFAKDELLLQAGHCITHLGLVLTGRVHIEHLDVWGSKTLLGQAGEGFHDGGFP